MANEARIRLRAFPLSAALLAGLLACVPDFVDDTWAIRAPRILAVRSVPAEAKPGATVALTALVATPTPQPSSGDRLEWAMCLARKPLTELGPVAQRCVDDFGAGGDVFLRLGRGASVSGAVPADACQRFGPLSPPATAAGVSARPVDPDLSGGYQQPIILGSELGTALATVRLACGVVGIPNAEAIRFNQGYRPNENPEIERLDVVSEGEVRTIPSGIERPGVTLRAASRVELRATWAGCPREPTCGDRLCTAGESQSSCAEDCRDAPRGCTGAESYLWANPETRSVQPRREGISVAWYATGGTFAEEQTGRTESDADEPTASNTWTAPATAGVVHVWVVLRDDRGGVGWGEYLLQVE